MEYHRLTTFTKLPSIHASHRITQGASNPLVIPPILASFPNGIPHNIDTLAFKCRATDNQGGTRRRRLQLKAETDYVKYQANQPAVSRKVSAKYMIGVYSKQKKQMVIHPIEAVIPITQTVKVRSSTSIYYVDELLYR